MNKKQLSLYMEENYKVQDGKKKGKPRTPLMGVGINDAAYLTWTKEDSLVLVCPAYQAWQEIIRRCYNSREKEASYKKAVLCDEWRSFSKFRTWWLDNWKEGYEIDKDILTDTKVYGPHNCIFVPRWLNLMASGKKNTGWKGGVRLYKGSYQERIVENKKRLHLGCFKTEAEAYKVWLERKIKIAESCKEAMDAIDTRIFPRILEIINRI